MYNTQQVTYLSVWNYKSSKLAIILSDSRFQKNVRYIVFSMFIII